MRFEIDDRFAQPPEQVVSALLDPALQHRLHTATLDYQRWEEAERTDHGDGTMERTLAVTPRVALPGFVRAALGDATGYREHQVWAEDRRSYRWRVDFELSRAIELAGTCTFTPEDGGTRRTIVADCRVGVPLLGGKLADYVREETTRTQHQAAEALARELAGRPAGDGA